VDVSLKEGSGMLQKGALGVSILVLVDVSLKVFRPQLWIVSAAVVSILVLVDVSLKV